MILTEQTTEVLGEKPVPMPICLTKISHGLTWDRIRPSAMTDQLVTTRAMARERESTHKSGGGGEEKLYFLN
jgi:hypothetical protein